MAFHTGQMNANPRLGIYFSIFAALVIGLVFFLLIIEQLGGESRMIRLMMVGVPLSLFALIAVLAFTLDAPDFFVVGRRVPAFFGGLGIAITAIGSVGVIWATGVLFHAGFDGLALILGVMAGLVVLGLVLAPYCRKLGAYSVSGFLGARFGSRSIRLISAILFVVPCMMFLAAEIVIGAKLLGMIVDRSEEIAIMSFVLALIFLIIWGGMRGLVWTNGAQGIVGVIALLVLPMVAALLLTNIPLPQITYGTLLADLSRFEAENGLRAVVQSRSDLGGLFDAEQMVLRKPFLQAFGLVGRVDFLLIVLTIMAGIVAAPHLIARMTVSPGVSENRKTLGWACLVLGFILLTLPAIAVFVRYTIFDRWVGMAPDQLPNVMEMIVRGGLFSVVDGVERLGVQDILLSPEGVLVIFPAILNFPDIFTYFLISAVIGLALATASAQLLTISTLLTVDVGFIGDEEAHHSVFQTIIVRLLMVVIGSAVGWGALHWAGSSIDLLLYGLQISAAVGFPVLVMSVWWKRLNILGALSAMLAGGGVTMAYILVVGGGLVDPIFAIDPRISAIFGVPIGFAMGVIVSLFTPQPDADQVELVRDMRISGGETLYDRTIRYAKLKAQRAKVQ